MRTITPPAPGHGAPQADPHDGITSRLLLCGAVAGPLFVLALLLQGAVRADYDPLRHPGSSLTLGEYGWVQAANFIVAGVLSLAFAFGLRRALGGAVWGPILVGIWAVGLIGAGVFTSDPVSGYPPGTPAMLPEHSSQEAALHDLFSLLGFVALVLACVVLARRGGAGWAVYSVASAAAFAVAMVLASAAFTQNPALVAYGGLLQRTAVIVGWAWLAVLAVRLPRGGTRAGRSRE